LGHYTTDKDDKVSLEKPLKDVRGHLREKETGTDDCLLEEGDSEEMENGSPHLVDF
jgi:hypothetical protein